MDLPAARATEIEIRYARPDEFGEVAELDGASFGFHYSEEELAAARLDIDPDRVLVARRDGRLVAISAEVPLDMTLPGDGAAGVPVLGLTWVSVELTDRRRGVLRAVVEDQLRAGAAAGFAASVLGASEGGIYGRFGFGVATQVRRTAVQRLRARLAVPVDTSAVRRLSGAAARAALP